MKNICIYTKLLNISKKNKGYLEIYKTDLTKHDKQSLSVAKMNDGYIWVLRKCGTNLLNMPANWNKHREIMKDKYLWQVVDNAVMCALSGMNTLEYYLRNYNAENNLFYIIKINQAGDKPQGTVEKIDGKQALEAMDFEGHCLRLAVDIANDYLKKGNRGLRLTDFDNLLFNEKPPLTVTTIRRLENSQYSSLVDSITDVFWNILDS